MKAKIVLLSLIIVFLTAISGWKIVESLNVTSKKVLPSGKTIDYVKIKEVIGILKERKPLMDEEENEASTSAKPQEILVSILNGSKKSGVAADLKKRLEEIENLKVGSLGNISATSSTTVRMKTNLPENIREAVVSIVGETSGKVNTEELKDTIKEDIVIILGIASP